MKMLLKAAECSNKVDAFYSDAPAVLACTFDRVAIEEMLRSRTVKPPTHGSEEIVQVDLVMRGIL